MKNNENMDWYDKLKYEIISLSLFLKFLENEKISLLGKNFWLLEDINLFESFTHLEEMILESSTNLDELVKRVYFLDLHDVLFDKNDLLDEFCFIKENIHLEAGYFINIMNYAIINKKQDYDLQDLEKLEQYREIDISCYNQMKINNENLKQLKKERRDLF